jgi:predicted O-methyltransferase YrrM
MNSITIDSSDCRSTLCRLCAESGTDKCPYNLHGHRHPYSVPYSLFFEPLKNKPIKFAEIGVFRGASLRAWRSFFTNPNARIFGYDRDIPNLEFIATMGLPNVALDTMDASKSESIREKLQQATQDGELFDVILDDASHDPADQCEVIKTALPFLKQGGLLIIEDIFRERPTKPYEEVFPQIQDLVSFHTFIVCDHALRYSPGWNNDKLLVFVRA